MHILSKFHLVSENSLQGYKKKKKIRNRIRILIVPVQVYKEISIVIITRKYHTSESVYLSFFLELETCFGCMKNRRSLS